MLNALNSWAANSPGTSWESAVPEIYADVLSKIQETLQIEKKDQVKKFLEDVKMYDDRKADLEKDLADAQTAKDAQRYRSAWRSLVNTGYVEGSLATTVLRASEDFDKE